MKFKLSILSLFFVLISEFTNAQYISRAEPVPYACPVVCAGGSFIIRIFHVQNVGNGGTIQVLLSNQNGQFGTGTTVLEATRYRINNNDWFDGPYNYPGGNVSELFFEITMPPTLTPGNQYTLKIQSSNGFVSNDLFQCGGINAITVTPYEAPLPAVAQNAAGNNQWIGHVYTWTATTNATLNTPALINQQNFFNPVNYKGHILKDNLNLDVILHASGGVPGNWTDGTSISCGTNYLTNFSMRLLRKENFVPGLYRVQIAGDDGIRLSIDGGATWLLDSFIEQAYAGSQKSTDIDYPQGICLNGETDLVVEYFQRPMDARITVTFTQLSQGGSGTLNVTADGPLSFCEGQSVTLTVDPSATGVIWSNNATTPSIIVTEAGTYYATAESGEGCPLVSASFEIVVEGEGTPIEVSASGPLAICQGQTVTLTAESGFTNYVWSNQTSGATLVVTQPGSYSVTANTASGCAVSSEVYTVIIDNNQVGVLNVTPSGFVEICEGQSITLVADPGFSTYNWSHGPQTPSTTITEAGVYSVTAQSSGDCSAASENITVIVIDVPEAGFSYEQTSGYTIEFSNESVNGNSYLWDFGGGNTSTQENPSFTYPFEGLYPVKLTVTNQCGTHVINVNINVLKLNVNNIKQLDDIKLYPNPANELFYLSSDNLKNKNFIVQMYDATQRLIIHESINNSSGQVIMHVAHLESGIYFININGDNFYSTQKIIITK
jgi:PKD repeat protein